MAMTLATGVSNTSSLPVAGSVNNALRPKPSKSIFRSIFNWKKTTPSGQGNDCKTYVIESDAQSTSIEQSIQHPSTNHQISSCTQRPDSNQAHEPHSLSRSKSFSGKRPQSQSQSRTSAKQTPLCLVYAQASLHSCLQVPNKRFLDRLPLNAGRRSSAVSSRTASDESQGRPSSGNESDKPRSRDGPEANDCPLASKLFVLSKHGQIFQYKSEGPPDRLPEKVIHLTSDSVAFASDAIAGQYWVLEISTSNLPLANTKSVSTRSTWSKLSQRSSETGRIPGSLLIVYDNPELMSTWLTAIRKEIEVLGGLRYRSENPTISLSLHNATSRESSGERPGLRESMLRLSRSSSNLRLDLGESSLMSDKDLPLLPVPYSYQRSISGRSVAASSIATANSLDKLRDTENGSFATNATNSMDGSLAIESPVKAIFASLANPLPSIESRASLLVDSHIQKDLSTSEPAPSQNNISDPPATCIPVDDESDKTPQSESPLQLQSMKRSSDPSQTTMTSSRPVLYNTEGSSKLLLLRSLSSGEPAGHLEQPHTKRPASSHTAHLSKASVDGQSKSMYSIFPKRFAQAVKAEPLIIPERNQIPGLPSNHATDHLEMPPTPMVTQPILTTQSPSTSSGNRKPAPLKLLAALEIEQPQRSPAVSDDMLASNFGTGPTKALHSPVSPSKICVPSLDDLPIDLNFLRQNAAAHDVSIRRSSSIDREFPPTRRNRSASNAQGSTRAPVAPVGPPPKGPLPAVPKEDISATSSRSSSQTGKPPSKGNYRNLTSSHPTSPPRKPSSFTQSRDETRTDGSIALKRQNDNNTSWLETSPLPSPKLQTDSFGIPSVISNSTLAPTQAFASHNSRQALNNTRTKSMKSLRGHKRAKSSGSKSISESYSNLITFNLSRNWPNAQMPPPCKSQSERDRSNWDDPFSGF